MNKDAFQSLIRRVLKEEVEKRTSTGSGTTQFQRVPEVKHDRDYKEIVPHKKDKRSKDEYLDDITKVVKAVDSSFVAVWDDHDDISISGRDLFRIRIIPKWENNFCIEAMIRNEDRIYVTGQTWEQVKEFVKANLKSSEPATDKALDKVHKNQKAVDQKVDKGLPQKDKPELKPLTNEPPKMEKNKEKDFTEKQTTGDDKPNRPMKEVGDFKRQEEFKANSAKKLVKEKTHYPPKKANTTLTVKVSDQDTTKFKKK
jgi:hypothetical protein